MGHLQYGQHNTRIQFPDRTLAHLQVALSQKLRDHEGFFFTWTWAQGVYSGFGRNCIWIAPGILLSFRFSDAQRHVINAAWVHEMSARDPLGLWLDTEPEPKGPGAPKGRS